MAELLPAFESASPAGQELDLNFDNHHYLFMVIYLFSNDIVHANPYEVTLAEILQMTLKFVPRRLLLTLLHMHLPSIKAAWEKLLLGAQKVENEEAFRFLITFGMKSDWLRINDQGHEYLFSAARMNCSDILQDLLAKGCRPNSYPSWCFHKSIIAEALGNGSLDCAKLLIQHYDVNYELQTERFASYKSTQFADFMIAFDDTNPDHLHCMELFLERGADVDYQLHEYHSLYCSDERIGWYWEKARVSGLHKDWPLSILDYVYYRRRSLFPRLAKYSKTVSQLSRARALWHLDQGLDSLREYLASDTEFPRSWGRATENDTNEEDLCQRQDHFLEVLLAEQCLLSIDDPVDEIWWTRVKDLSVLDIDFKWLAKPGKLATSILQTAAELIKSVKEPDKEHGSQMIQWLLGKGFRVDADTLKTTFFNANVATLDRLASFCDNLKEEGGYVLALAVSRSDFSATRMLLDRGVDINTTFVRGQNIFESAACGSIFAMMEYVVQRGAKPRASEQGYHLSHLLFDMFSDTGYDLFIKVQYLVEKYITIDEPLCLSANLLEKCISNYSLSEERMMAFELLWKKGAKLNPGSPLAQWIAYGGGQRLVQEMLDADADPNGCSYDTNAFKGRTPLQAAAGIGDYALVCMLMDRGADLNGPAFGDYGQTALQAICAWDPVRQEERLRKDKIMTVFLEKGADVNATNSRGHTALFYAAQLGDLSSAFRLLKYGAKVNMATSRNDFNWTGTALDTAACYGRLDMVGFLLNANALSSTADSDGKDYDGAIRLAREHGHFVVSELICKYSVDRRRWDTPHGQAIDTMAPPELASQMLSPLAKSGAIPWPRSERPFSPSGNIQGVVILDRIDGLSNAFEEDMVESSTAASKAMGRGMSGADAPDMSCTRVIEEIENEPPLADSGCERPSEDKTYGAGHQAVDTKRASSGPAGWLYQPREQNWVEDEQQDVDPLVSSNSSTDVFMGFSEFPSP